MKIFVGISGASGVNLGLRLANEVAKRAKLHLVLSKSAKLVLEKEQNLRLDESKFNSTVVNTGLNLRADLLSSGGKFDENLPVCEAKFNGAKQANLTNEALKFNQKDNNARQNSDKFEKSFLKSEENLQSNLESKYPPNLRREIFEIWQNLQANAQIYDNDDLAAPPSSGSFGTHATIIAPCSINTLAKIHASLADTLIARTAAVALKERRRLVLGVREMPFSTLNLEQMSKLSNLGAIIAPPILGYYSQQANLAEMENFIIGKWLDLLGIEHQIYKRWE